MENRNARKAIAALEAGNGEEAVSHFKALFAQDDVKAEHEWAEALVHTLNGNLKLAHRVAEKAESIFCWADA